ncbi:MAG TPA: GtrA family protein [Bryobacteraceae bacterium]|jgi:putative flippase GtrA
MSRETRFGKFSVVGLMGAVVQVFVFDLLLKPCHLPAAAAAAIAVEIAVLHNFCWHERFTWRERNATSYHRAARLWRFHISNGFVPLAVNALLTWFLLRELKAPPVLPAVIAIAFCAPANFLLADRWVFPARYTWEKQ